MTIVVSTSSISSVTLYNSLVQDIYNLTARPDLVNETAVAIRKATMKLHLVDFWKSDLVSALYTLPVYVPADFSYRYTIDLTDTLVFPLIRKVAHVKEYNTPLSGRETQFKELSADRLLDAYLLEDINYWYQVGQSLHVRCNKNLTQIDVGYWKYPNVIPATYDSWIAQQFPDAVIDEACAQLFRIIGKDAEAVRLTAEFPVNVHAITMAQV